jgi:2-polyprenyl-3-methyl-5-hydroxy-6-metoxy-1,4-benzoquinol methylase
MVIRCNLCGSEEHIEFLRCDGFKYVKCSCCGLVYQNPQPVFEDLRLRYDRRYFQYELENEANFFNLMKLGMRDIGFYNRSIDSFENNRFLDIGCATGMLISHMKSLGWKSQGVEICRESAEYGIEKRGVDIYIGLLEEAAFPTAHFAVIHLSHLIEHVPDPKGFLGEIYRILSERGEVILTTPNVGGFQARLFRQDWRSAIADHITLFSKTTLGRMLEGVGFRIRRTVTWGGLAKGRAANFIKRPVDFLAKRFGFGDVVLMHVTK